MKNHNIYPQLSGRISLFTPSDPVPPVSSLPGRSTIHSVAMAEAFWLSPHAQRYSAQSRSFPDVERSSETLFLNNCALSSSHFLFTFIGKPVGSCLSVIALT